MKYRTQKEQNRVKKINYQLFELSKELPFPMELSRTVVNTTPYHLFRTPIEESRRSWFDVELTFYKEPEHEEFSFYVEINNRAAYHIKPKKFSDLLKDLRINRFLSLAQEQFLNSLI